MVFRRKIYNDLLNWKNNSQTLKSGLLIEGPRRVGKTKIIEEFAKKEYKNYLLIDFMYASDELKVLFDHLDDLDSFFSNLFLYCGKALKPGDLIIFDEVQWCPKARQGIKKFVNDGRFDYIETGSLLSIRENVSNITIPSEETRIEMYPMDFEEFLWAIKKDDIAQLIKDAYNKKFAIQNSIHENLIKLFRQYLAIGGMPRVITILSCQIHILLLIKRSKIS